MEENKSIDMDQFLENLDALYTDGKAAEIEDYLLDGIRRARECNQPAAEFFMQNELMGHYRVVSKYEECMACVRETKELADRMGLQGTVHYGTMLLNMATGCRAAGEYGLSEKYYLQAIDIYGKLLPETDYRMASLHNNISLLYGEIGRLDEAKRELLQALAIIEKLEDSGFQVAITYTNLGNLCFKMGEHEQGTLYMEKAAALFEQGEGENDAHYASVLAGLAESYFHGGDLEKSLKYYEKSLRILEENYGRNEAFEITAQNRDVVRDLIDRKKAFQNRKGLELSRLYYEKAGKPMLEEKYPAYIGRIAVGLVGEGSECLGYDDAYSTDHDYGPGFCVWLTKEDYEQIGKQMQADYDRLPDEFMGFPGRNTTGQSGKRVGVFEIGEFYRNIVGCERAPERESEWAKLQEEMLRTVTNGEVFEDPLGEFSSVREGFCHRPEAVRLQKLCEQLALAGQAGQYNLPRMLKRGDFGSAHLCRNYFADAVISIGYLLNRRYRPFYKWQIRDMEQFTVLRELPEKLVGLMETSLQDEELMGRVEEICRMIVKELHAQRLSGSQDNFLEEQKAAVVETGKIRKLTDAVVRLEWKQFQEVQNEGGRASCQNNPETFSIMRKSQFLAWDLEVLASYANDLMEAEKNGWNLLTEKYARMMESTAPEEYERLKNRLPQRSAGRVQMQERIIRRLVGWDERFEKKYPKLSGQGRSLYTAQDTFWNTSKETYARGELGTYSDRTAALYDKMTERLEAAGENLTQKIMENMIDFYGYRDLETAEAAV